jgi:hypothetical protein
MPKDHSAVGARHVHVCEGEDVDASRVVQIVHRSLGVRLYAF